MNHQFFRRVADVKKWLQKICGKFKVDTKKKKDSKFYLKQEKPWKWGNMNSISEFTKIQNNFQNDPVEQIHL